VQIIHEYFFLNKHQKSTCASNQDITAIRLCTISKFIQNKRVSVDWRIAMKRTEWQYNLMLK